MAAVLIYVGSESIPIVEEREMRNLRLAAIVGCLLLGVNVVTTKAQESQQQLTQVVEVKVKSKGSVVRVVNKSKPVLNAALAELEVVFAVRMQAYMNKDYDTLVNQISPDYSATLPNGETVSYEQIKTYIRRNLDRFISIKSQSMAIENAKVDGNEAIVDVRQIVSRLQKFADGSTHEVTTGVLQQETWVRTASVWKLRSVSNIRDESILVDGKPLNPTRP